MYHDINENTDVKESNAVLHKKNLTSSILYHLFYYLVQVVFQCG